LHGNNRGLSKTYSFVRYSVEMLPEFGFVEEITTEEKRR